MLVDRFLLYFLMYDLCGSYSKWYVFIQHNAVVKAVLRCSVTLMMMLLLRCWVNPSLLFGTLFS